MTTTQWLGLSMPLRMKLKEVFVIPRSSGTHVQDNTIISDGHTHGDLAHITVEKMQTYLHSEETDFFELLNASINKAAVQILPTEEKTDVPVPAPDVRVVVDGVEHELVTPRNAPLYPSPKKIGEASFVKKTVAATKRVVTRKRAAK